MEILHFCPSRSYSGLEQYALQLALDQKRRGLGVAFVVGPDTELLRQCQKNAIETILFDPFKTLGTLRFWPSFIKQVAKTSQLKAIHIHSTQELAHLFPPLTVLRAFKGNRPKVILQVHIWINHKKKDPLHRLLYSLVDEVWCSSQMAKESLLELLPVKEEKYRIINYARDVEKLEQGFLTSAEARVDLRLPADDLILGTVSRIEESKGIRELLLATLPYLKRIPTLHLVVIGGASPHDDKAEAYGKNLQDWIGEQPDAIRRRIHFLGAVRDSYKFLKAFNLYVLPSYQECFSLSLLDAQLAGLPVVGSESGGTPEIVRHGQTGWLFKPRDVESLAQALGVALAQEKEWKTLGEKARTRVQNEFDQKLIFEEVIKGYDLST